ncbi:trans-sulfuration enzyme family protein [Spirillospora sp. NPDC048911]|uniref:trans-sulfuration enzyme family protein n=1 Tax=Spirillospora sp. NPDC048911 TaxID=3364527 RepID=UPI003710C730
MRRDTRRQGENTRAVHLPSPPVPRQSPVGLPIWRTSAFAFEGAAEHADVVSDRTPGHCHGRVANPTADAFAAGLASLEGAGLGGEPVTGQAFGSGMAAVTAVFLAFARAGAHVIAPSTVYGGTRDLLVGLLNRFGVDATFVDMAEPGAALAAMRPATRLVWAETIADRGLDVPDLPLLADIAHEGGALLAVDSSLATPVVCRPLEHGADLVVHSATTFIGGHGDATGGAVIGRPELVEAVRRVRIETGSVLAPDEAFLLRRGLETLPVRVRRQCDTANLFAAAVAGHPGVRAVDYPGLPGHRGHELGRRLFTAGPEGTRFGAIVTLTPDGGREAGQALVDALRLPLVATSLGGTHTTVGHIASTTHHRLDEAELGAAGIDPAAVRFSIGLEDADDLVRDVTEALDAVSRGLPFVAGSC